MSGSFLVSYSWSEDKCLSDEGEWEVRKTIKSGMEWAQRGRGREWCMLVRTWQTFGGRRQAGGSRLLPATPSYPCQWTFLEAPLSSLSKNPENHFISSWLNKKVARNADHIKSTNQNSRGRGFNQHSSVCNDITHTAVHWYPAKDKQMY